MPRTKPPIGHDEDLDGWLDVDPPERDDRVDAGLYGLDDAVDDRFVARQRHDLDAEHRRASRVGSWFVRPFWMTEYMMNSSGIWRSSGQAARTG